MQVPHLILSLLVWLQVKHFVADYLLQPHWILKGKGELRSAGGHIHAAIHALGSIPAYLIAGLGAAAIATLVLAEFVIHYAIDFTKAKMSRRNPAGPDKAAFWAMHGADQLLHQLTYAGLIYCTLILAGRAG